MNDDDEYLWSRSGPIDVEVAGLERELGTLGWQPRPLPVEPAQRVMVRPIVNLPRAREWPALIAGLAMAATVLSAVYLARREPDNGHRPSESSPSMDSLPAIHPAGQPQHSPDLRDPFSRKRDDVRPPPAGDLRDPFGTQRPPTPTPRTQADLKDPFSNNPARPPHNPFPTPGNNTSPDLKDPFTRPAANSAQSPAGPLMDPFLRPSNEPSQAGSGDLVDPFTRPR